MKLALAAARDVVANMELRLYVMDMYDAADIVHTGNNFSVFMSTSWKETYKENRSRDV